MGFMAAAIPIATAVLSSMSKQNQPQQPQAAMPPPPTLGQIFAQNWQNNNQQSPFPGTGKY